MKTENWLKLAFCAALLLAGGLIANAQTVQPQVLAHFSGPDGFRPRGGLTLGPDGAFYGTTERGGALDLGTIFKITTNGVKTVLVSLTPSGGKYPHAGLTLGNDGAFYGTTVAGGSGNCGTIFRVTTNGSYSLVQEFSGAQGYSPEAALTLGTDGNFYGTTALGEIGSDDGSRHAGAGTVFKVTPAGTYTLLTRFDYFNKGSNPHGKLVQDSEGNFLGTTSQGGLSGHGTVFKISSSGAFTKLADFNNVSGGETMSGVTLDGQDNISGLDNIFVTTFEGGGNGYGAIARVPILNYPTPALGAPSLQFNFDYYSRGSAPRAELVRGSDGAFYGTASDGGLGNSGTVFRVSTNGTFITLVAFNGVNGSQPYAPVTSDGGTNLYGTTAFGGDFNGGVIYCLPVQPGVESNAVVVATNSLVIVSQPASQVRYVGSSVHFNVIASGGAPIAYQWRLNGTNLINGGSFSGVTATNLTITNIIFGYAGNYSVVVTNSSGPVTSSVATLSVISNATAGVVWTNDISGNWEDKTNWSPNAVPGPLDTATINLGVTVTVNGDKSIYNLNLGSGATLDGYDTLTVDGIMQSSGTVSLPLKVGAGGLLNWMSGTVNSQLTVDTGGTLTLTNATTAYSLYGTLMNNGTVVMGGSSGYDRLYLTDPAKIYNNGLWLSQGIENGFYNNDGLTNKLFANTGTFRQTGSGSTSFEIPFTTTGTIDQQGGTLSVPTWAGANILHGIAIFDGNLGSAAATINIASNAVVGISSGSIFGSLTISTNGTLTLTNATTAYSLYGTLTNNGTVVMGGSSGYDRLYLTDPAKIYNNGLWLSQGIENGFYNNDALTNKLFVNTGTFRKTGAGTTSFEIPFTTTGTIDQQGGTINAPIWAGQSTLRNLAVFSSAVGGAGATVNIVSNGIVSSYGANGNTTVEAGATLNGLGGTFALDGSLTISTNGTLTLTNATTAYSLYGTLMNNGTVVMGGSSGYDRLYLTDPAKIYNNGLWLSQGIENGFYNNDGLTNKLFANTGTFRQTGSGSTSFEIPFTTTGTIDQQGGTLSVPTWAGANILHGIAIFDGNLGSAAATINIASNAVVGISSGSIFGSLTISTNGTLTLTNATTAYSLYGTLTNNGTVVMGGSSGYDRLYLTDPAKIYNNGLWLSQGIENGFYNNDALTNKLFVNTGTFRKTGAGTTSFEIPFTTTGIIDQSGGTLGMSDLFVQSAGLTWLRGGSLSSSQPFQLLGGILAGTNTFTGSITNSGVVSPGQSPGKLTINGDYTQTANGVLKVELAGNSQGASYDWLAISGTAQLGGKLLVTLTNSFVPATNAAFTVLTANPRLGAFSIFSYPSNLAAIQISYGANQAVLNVTNVLASPTPSLAVPAVANNGVFSANIAGVPGATYVIEYTPTISPPNWQVLTNIIVPPSGVYQLQQPSGLSPNRFYRAYYLGY